MSREDKTLFAKIAAVIAALLGVIALGSASGFTGMPSRVEALEKKQEVTEKQVQDVALHLARIEAGVQILVEDRNRDLSRKP